MPKTARKSKLTEEQKWLIDQYYKTLLERDCARNLFESTTESELISACVFQLNAIQQRYSYLLSKIKEQNITNLPVLR